MAKNSKSNKAKTSNEDKKPTEEKEGKDKAQKNSTKVVVEESSLEPAPALRDPESDDSDESSSEEDEDLVLEGVLVRNRDVSSSDDSSSEEEEEEKSPSSKKRSLSKMKKEDEKDNKSGSQAGSSATKTKAAKKKETQDDDENEDKEPPQAEIVQVEFTFCDMNEQYFHGLKTLLTSSSPIYAAQSSALADLMIANVNVGTVVSTEGDVDGTVFGFASVLNVSTYQHEECIQALKKLCLDKCPAERKAELETVLSGKTKRPAGFFLQCRMVNMPLEIVEIMHQQLVLDMDWAVEHASGGEAERKSLDFGAFVRIAPTYRLAASSTAFKYFDDEILEQHAEFSYPVELPKLHGMEETPRCSILVLTKTGHRAAMKDIAQLINGSSR
jgi:BCCIP